MPQLYIAAAITTLMAVAVFGMLIRQLAPEGTRKELLLLACLGLTLSPLAYFLVRLPLIQIFEPIVLGTTESQPEGTVSETVRGVIRLLYAPLTEEPMKLVPWAALLLFGIMRRPTQSQIAALVLTIGVAFAIGEFWLVAYLIAAKPDPSHAHLPWYAFGGFISERLMTCFSHTLFALPTIWFCRRGVLFACFGLGIGMLLHFIGNAPIMLMRHEAFGLSKTTWGVLLQIWLALYVITTLFLLAAVHFGNEVIARIWQNRMICPECGETYRQPILLGLNMGTWRYEPCAACHKWHWVTIKNLAPLESSETTKLPLLTEKGGQKEHG